jgi:hypothetical protein
MPPKHMENFSGTLEMMQRKEHEAFNDKRSFLKAEN